MYSDLDYFIVDHNIISYAKYPTKNLYVFPDRNYISNSINRKSICGYVFIVFDGAICFSSTKQRFVNGSITEAKYIAFNQVFW